MLNDPVFQLFCDYCIHYHIVYIEEIHCRNSLLILCETNVNLILILCTRNFPIYK